MGLGSALGLGLRWMMVSSEVSEAVLWEPSIRERREVLASWTIAAVGGSQDGVRECIDARGVSWLDPFAGCLNGVTEGMVVGFAGDIHGDSSGSGEVVLKTPSAALKMVVRCGKPVSCAECF